MYIDREGAAYQRNQAKEQNANAAAAIAPTCLAESYVQASFAVKHSASEFCLTYSESL